MPKEDVDDLVTFRHVRVVRSTAPTLFCAIEGKRVWLPREHIKGNLWCRGDCGTLLVRRWVAVDRHLNIPDGADMVSTVEPVVALRNPPAQMRLLPRPHEVHRGH